MFDEDDEPQWLYRGVPAESPEVKDVCATGEVVPPRPDLVGEKWRDYHVAGYTESGYTSWTSDRSMAEAAASEMSDVETLSGNIIVFRVSFADIDREHLFPGRDDESEFLIEGRIEFVEISSGDEEDF